jgi:hypothetical protein
MNIRSRKFRAAFALAVIASVASSPAVAQTAPANQPV